MQSAAPRPVHLSEWRPYPFAVEEVALTFRLAPTATRVHARIAFRRTGAGPLALHGEGLRLIGATIDATAVVPRATPDGIEVDAPDGAFVWESEVEIAPQSNTSLSGLYISNGMYCTQCEAEGFRRITYYPDRPDVMAPFRVRIESDLPVLLSNGNPGAQGAGFAEWHDPWPKPAYLFALVAGDLRAHRDHFTTMEGREVDLAVWVRPGDEALCGYAMDALKRSMVWDERSYGRAYDLDVFNIVAVDDFNMGAMENKGLNVFNSRYVLASPQTATDGDYARIEGIVAHEYFHNWTGNRITCRDWFQLCLKEGLTVYRDQCFTGDERGHALKRIEDVQMLRARQFREDAGPLAHPVRPDAYVEINNFYTATVYEKGAEVIGMLRRLVGGDAYRAALDLYFERHDGQACTIEDWLTVFEDATGRDLSRFKLWYTQAGTPRLRVRHRVEGGRLHLDLAQSTPPTPGQDEKAPLVIPLAVGAIARDGREVLPTRLVEFDTATASVSFDVGVEDAVPSLLREFSAPVILDHDPSDADRALLLSHDTDPFNRWEAARGLAKGALMRMSADGAPPDAGYLDALEAMLSDDGADPAFRAELLSLPSADDLAQSLAEAGRTPDPRAIDASLASMADAMSARLKDRLARIHDALTDDGPYSPDAASAGRRTLRNAALSLLTRRDGGARARAQIEAARNMTDETAALAALLRTGQGEAAARGFRERWQGDMLVMDKWFALQVALAPGESGVAVAARLAQDPDFAWTRPNRFRSVFGALGQNHGSFHAADGSGYALMADWLIKLDPLNPQTAARMSSLFETWRRYDADRQDLARAALDRLLSVPDLSRDTTEMVSRMIAA